jgi:outer membrane lipoprotein-sorting protein
MLRRQLFLFLSFLSLTLAASPEEARGLLEQWMKAASQVRTVEAEFDQLRTLSTVKVPLKKPGRLWMDKAGLFRWQIGDPPSMTVLRDKAGKLTVLEAKGMKAKVWSKEALLNEEKQGRGQGFAMLQTMQAPSMEEFEKTFEIKGGTPVAGANGQWQIQLALKDRQSSVFVREVQFTIDLSQGTLKAMQITMRDGSSMGTVIKQVKLNESIPASVFNLDTSGYIVEEMK